MQLRATEGIQRPALTCQVAVAVEAQEVEAVGQAAVRVALAEAEAAEAEAAPRTMTPASASFRLTVAVEEAAVWADTVDTVGVAPSEVMAATVAEEAVHWKSWLSVVST